MTHPQKVTVDKVYFDALLRRADYVREHTSPPLVARHDLTNFTISKVEYDSLLRVSREYELLKSALFQGGITSETLDLLISGASSSEARKDSANSTANPWADDFEDVHPAYNRYGIQEDAPARDAQWRQALSTPGFNPGNHRTNDFTQARPGDGLRAPSYHRQASYGAPPSSVPDEVAFDDEDLADATGHAAFGLKGLHPGNERRTLYFNGFSDRTTYKDFISIIKGGKLLSINLRSERSGTATFFDGAETFLAWAKKHDIYLHSKRLEVKWADRQYKLNNHIFNKIQGGATRNILIRHASSNGLSAPQIRDDMEHIHNLYIIDVTFRNGDAYVSTNSVHNALFARTCMMSRTTYKGCKIEFYRDECDVPLPAPTPRMRPPQTDTQRQKSKATLANRFDLLNTMDGAEQSDEGDADQRVTPDRTSDDDETIDMTGSQGVSLKFLDSESTY